MSTVRTRFAPSPTGYLHIGGLRTALYAYLLAKQGNGQFILRIEDTDQNRYVEGAVDFVYKTLRMCGLNWDEGPDIGGGYGPYIQSHRREIYQQYARQLVELGGAYYCFCSKEREDELRAQAAARKEAYVYDRHCRNLSADEVEDKLKAGHPYVIRQKMPTSGTTSFDDVVYGTITVENTVLEDGVLLKSDGLPTYNFANVIDDHLMEITHVIRGSEYLSSTPRYNLLYQAFGWDPPIYVHVSQILREPGKKLSKRDGDASFEDFHSRGYLTDAILNYIALLGWSPGTDEEFFALQDLVEHFSIDGIAKSDAIFDAQKLRWMNGEYIRKLSIEAFHELALPYYQQVLSGKDLNLLALSRALHPRTEVLGEIPDYIDFLQKLPDYSTDLFFHKKMKSSPDTAQEYLPKAKAVLESVKTWDETHLHDALLQLAAESGVKNGIVLWPVRVALSGKESSPGGAIELAAVLGREETMHRMEIGITKLDAGTTQAQ